MTSAKRFPEQRIMHWKNDLTLAGFFGHWTDYCCARELPTCPLDTANFPTEEQTKRMSGGGASVGIIHVAYVARTAANLSLVIGLVV